jgi:hypothetical protein
LVQVTLQNPSAHLAFMVHPELLQSGEPVTPVFWEANYITLLPGETRKITAWCHSRDLHGQLPAVSVDGWNITTNAPKPKP